MRVFMQAHGVWDAVEPKDADAAIEDKMDKRALAIIYQGIDKVKKAKAQTLKAEFESLVMKDTEQLDDFCMKMNSLRLSNLEIWRKCPLEEVVGSLKAHEERIRGQNEVNNSQLMLTEEEWSRREGTETKLLFTRDEWLKRANKGGNGGNGDYRKDGRMFRDRSRVKCFNCHNHGHFASECRKPRRDREQRAEANLTQITDDEPALLVAEFDKIDNNRGTKLNTEEDNTWYLDNGASSHMTGQSWKVQRFR
ncbi:uncharacterized protein LOC141704844 [Apium graveolens]|uniref:uncharacterized protein LOC141704844 n=1 Tax=Apium graveolens TaxID=4045 RepID=UPI003D79C292